MSSGPKSVPSSMAQTFDRQALQQRSGLLDAGEHAERPVGLREALEPDLRLDVLVETPGVQDLDGAIEVDVRDLAGLDLGL